jgi:hypothetical protein
MNKYSKLSKQVDGVTLSDVNATDLTNLELTYGEEFRDMLANVFSSLERSGDYEIIAAGYGNFIT